MSNRRRLPREPLCPCGQHPATEPHPYPEAFKLMAYRSDDGTETRQVWNARNGVTPFVITFPSGRRATHVNWAGDRYAPLHQPAPGDLVFTGGPDTPQLTEWPG